MATTPNFNVVYPTTGNALTPLATHFANLANSVDTALTKAGATAGSVAARNALFPSPVHGDKVFRTDLMKFEQYYGAYNSSTNPSGATTAGWYMPDSTIVRTRQAAFTIPTSNTTLDFSTSEVDYGGLFSYAAGVLTCKASGNIKYSGSVTAAPGTTFYTIRLFKNGVAIRASGMGLSSSSNSTNTINGIIGVTAGDTLELKISAGGNTGGVLNDTGSTTYLSAQY